MNLFVEAYTCMSNCGVRTIFVKCVADSIVEWTNLYREENK